MGQLRAALSAILTMLGPDADPADALAQLNQHTPRVPGARGSTAVCMILDTHADTLRWARAGHPPPLQRCHDGRVVVLDDAAGPLLGAYTPDNATTNNTGRPLYTTAATGFAPGDTVLLYTDGLVERRGEIIDEGIDRLATATATLMSIDPTRQVPHLLAAVVPDGHRHDDIALVAARRLPPPLHARHPARAPELNRIRRTVTTWAAATGLHPDHADDLQLALGEALANAVEHAYRDREPGDLDYTLRRTAHGVHAAVTDFGTWQPPPPDPGYRGRGLPMIHTLGDAVTLHHDDAGTVLRFTMPLPPETPRRDRPIRPRPHPPRTPPSYTSTTNPTRCGWPYTATSTSPASTPCAGNYSPTSTPPQPTPTSSLTYTTPTTCPAPASA
jgi:anti-sigma regulatory factor (Ser/Thr protein kinase)